jgi:16S rRNA processing protein RimM
LDLTVRLMPEPSAAASTDLVVVGRVRRSHGVHGVLVVEPMTSSPEFVFATGRQLIAGTTKGEPAVPRKEIGIEMAEPFQGGFRVQFSGIVGRDEADRWRNRYLLAPRAELPEPDENEIYLYDLVGLTVEGQDGEVIGRVEAYYELPHDVMIEVARSSGRCSFRTGSCQWISRGSVVMEPPEGLLTWQWDGDGRTPVFWPLNSGSGLMLITVVTIFPEFFTGRCR